MAKPRLVVDCNVYLRAFISRKSVSEQIVRFAEQNLIEIFISRYIISELKDVLARPEFALKFPHFTSENWRTFLNRIRKCSSYIRSVEPRFKLARDPKDSPYIDLAVHVEANHLVTNDRDLLDLMTGADGESKQFRQRFRDLRIMKPEEFVRVVSRSG